MTRGSAKQELYCLVAEMRSYGFEPASIADHLNLTPRRVQQVLADLRADKPSFDSLPALLRERITHFAKRTNSQAENLTHA
jgi:hypothetical protein